jgi:hypothetical protein
MHCRTCDADFDRTMRMPIAVSPVEVAGSTAVHLRVDLAWLETRIPVLRQVVDQS